MSASDADNTADIGVDDFIRRFERGMQAVTAAEDTLTARRRYEALCESFAPPDPDSLSVVDSELDGVRVRRLRPSGINDGAAAVLLMSRAEAVRRGLAPLATVVASATAGVDPALMGTGPIPAVRAALARAGWDKDDVDLYELNEAFASVVLRYMQAFDISHDKINVNGGAIAMGHPLGATGAMIVGTVLDELERRDLNTALVTLCIGAGMGTATIIERV